MKFKNLVEVLEYGAKTTPNSIAYTFLLDGEDKEDNITFLELLNKVKSVAHSLQKICKKGDTAILAYDFGLDVVVAFYACLFSGVIAVPMPPPEISNLTKTVTFIISIITNAKPKILLTTMDIKREISLFSLAIPEMRELHQLTTDNINIENHKLFKNIEIDSDTIAFLQYTSGSTSEPKGVINTHGNLLYNEEMIKTSYSHIQKDTQMSFISWVPFFHDMGLVGHIIQPLYVGARGILMAPIHFLEKPSRLIKAISKYKAQTTAGPNFSYDLCVAKVSEEEKKNIDLSCLKSAIVGSEPVKKETLDRFYEAFKNCGLSKESLLPSYGLAEATLIVSGGSIDEEFKTVQLKKDDLINSIVTHTKEEYGSVTLVSVGRTILEQKIKIVNPITLDQLPDNTLGEIWVNGKNVAKGYWDNPEETKRVFKARIKGDENLYYLKTGDIGFINEKEVYIVGRVKDIVIINGKNIYPQDIEKGIESKIKEFPEIRLGCVGIFGGEINNKEIIMLAMEIAPNRNPKFDINKLIESINNFLFSEYQMSFYSMTFLKQGQLPKTSSGKLQRNLYKKIFLNNSESKFNIDVIHKYEKNKLVSKKTTNNEIDENASKKEELRKWISEWFIDNLGLDTNLVIDMDQKLTDFITDSLFVVAFANDLEVKLNTHLPRDFLYKYPTMRDIFICIFN